MVEGIIDTEFSGTIDGKGKRFVFTDNPKTSGYNFKNADITKEYCETYSKLKAFTSGNGTYIAIFAKTNSNKVGLNNNKATFKNVHILVDKKLNTSGLIKEGVDVKQNNYISLFVAYANDTIFNNCSVKATTRGSLDISDDNKSATIYYGAMAGYTQNTTINGTGN